MKSNKKLFVIIIFFIIIIGLIANTISNLNLNEEITYSASNDIMSIEFTRFDDINRFLESAKDSSISIYNEISELKEIDGFILGEVKINSQFYTNNNEFKLELLRKDNSRININLLSNSNFLEINTLNVPFLSYDFENSKIESVVLFDNEFKITSLKLKAINR